MDLFVHIFIYVLFCILFYYTFLRTAFFEIFLVFFEFFTYFFARLFLCKPIFVMTTPDKFLYQHYQTLCHPISFPTLFLCLFSLCTI